MSDKNIQLEDIMEYVEDEQSKLRQQGLKDGYIAGTMGRDNTVGADAKVLTDTYGKAWEKGYRLGKKFGMINK